MFGLFKKHCPICGKEVPKEQAEVRFGEYFCCEEHAEEHRKKVAREKAKSGGRGGCCG